MPRPKSNLAPRILEAARARFLVEGVDGATLRNIAADAGTSIGMIYYYFPTKDDLFAAVVEVAYEGMLGALAEILASGDGPEQRLLKMYERIAAMNDEEFDVIRIVFREAMVSSDRLQKLARRALDGHMPFILSTLAEGRGAERFDPDLPLPAEMAATMALAMLPQIMLRLVGRAELPVAAMLPEPVEAARAMHRILLHGIAGRALPRPTDA